LWPNIICRFSTIFLGTICEQMMGAICGGLGSFVKRKNGSGEKSDRNRKIGIFKMNNQKNQIGKKIHVGLTLLDILTRNYSHLLFLPFKCIV